MLTVRQEPDSGKGKGKGKEQEKGKEPDSGEETERQLREKSTKSQKTKKKKKKKKTTTTTTTTTTTKRKKKKKMEPLSQRMVSEYLIGALSRHREIRSKETAFLRAEVASRRLATVAGRKAYLEGQSKAKGITFTPPPPHSADQMSVKVNWPYLVSNGEDALDLMLHEVQAMRYRISSLACLFKGFGISVSPAKVKQIRDMSGALAWVSERFTGELHESRSRPAKMDLKVHQDGWVSTWGDHRGSSSSFLDTTTVSPMLFTLSTPGIFPFSAVAGPALQNYSIKIVNLNSNLTWPLYIYGVVAARDELDHNRNLLFCRSRANCQRITQEDPFLRLCGPSRAIVAGEAVTFEVELKMKYGEEYMEEASFAASYNYRSTQRYSTPMIYSRCCTAELSLERLTTAIQATIMGVCVVGGEWPFKFGCQVSCFLYPPSPAAAATGKPSKVVLLDKYGGGGEEMPMPSDGYIRLSRNVVSVQVENSLNVVIQAYPAEPGTKPLFCHVEFPFQHCQTRTLQCPLGESTVQITVAWSRLASHG